MKIVVPGATGNVGTAGISALLHDERVERVRRAGRDALRSSISNARVGPIDDSERRTGMVLTVELFRTTEKKCLTGTETPKVARRKPENW
jgi:uncharacterized protein YbjT (DUF2867 family)